MAAAFWTTAEAIETTCCRFRAGRQAWRRHTTASAEPVAPPESLAAVGDTAGMGLRSCRSNQSATTLSQCFHGFRLPANDRTGD